MKKKIFFISLSCFALSSLFAQSLISTRATDLSGFVEELPGFLELKKEFPDGTRVTEIDIEYDDQDIPHIYRKGTNEKEEVYIEKFRLMQANDRLYMRLGVYGDKCMGKDCEFCLSKKGGCECKEGPHVCKYEVTKIRDALLLR